MFPNSSFCSQDSQAESSNFIPMEGTEGPFVQGRFAIDRCHKEFLYAGSSAWELTMEPISQLRQALAIIENVCRTSSTVWVNKLQCKQMADSFSAVGEALKGFRWDRNLVRSEPSDGISNREYPAFDELLTVLRKGESLVSYYNTWNVLGWMDSREAMFKDVIEELDIMKAQFHFEGLSDVGHSEDCAFPVLIASELSSVPRVVIEKFEMDAEHHDRLFARIWTSEQTTEMDMDMLNLDITSQIAESMYEVIRARDLIWGRINSGKVCNLSTGKGMPYAEIVFETYLPTPVLQAVKVDFINKVSRHPPIEGLAVGCKEPGPIVMDCMSDMNLKDLIESQRWRIPVPKECLTAPSNFYCDFFDILLQTEMAMDYLHSKGVVRRDLKSGNIVIVNQHPGPNRVDIVQLEHFGSCKGYGAGIGFQPFQAPELQRWESVDCPKVVDGFRFGTFCSGILTGRLPFNHTLPFVGLDGLDSMRKAALSKILYSEEQETFLKYLCENDWKEYGDVKSCLQKERLMSKVILDSVDDVGTEDNFEAFEVSAFKSIGREEEEIVICENSKYSSFASPEGLVHVDGAHENRRRAECDIVNIDTELILEGPADAQAMDDEVQPCETCPPKNAVGSCAPEATSNSPSFVQQDSTEILCGHQVPQIPNDGEPARKRNRTRIWTDDEKLALLELTEEAPRLNVGPDWKYVSDNLLEYGFDRASTSCQQQWDSLLHSYRAIQDHESTIQSDTSSCVSYWEMNEDERSYRKLQRAFDFEWFEVIERIRTAKPFEEETRIFQMDANLPSSALPLCQLQSSAIHMDHFGSANCHEVRDDESTDEESEETDIQSEVEGLSVDSTASREFQAEVTADSDDPEDPEDLDAAKQSYESCYETNAEYHINEQSRAKSFCETNSKYAGRKRSGKDDLISRIAPYVNKQVDDALKSLVSVLRRRKENEQKHRVELLAIEEAKLALKREKMEFRRRALASSNELPALFLPQINQNQDLARTAASDVAPR